MEASDGHEERDTVKGTSENSHGSFVDIVLQSTTTPRMRAAKANQRRETLIGIYNRNILQQFTCLASGYFIANKMGNSN